MACGFGLFGALAQLGEHLLCKQRVIGSIPIGSTNLFHGMGSASAVHGAVSSDPDAFDNREERETSEPLVPPSMGVIWAP